MKRHSTLLVAVAVVLGFAACAFSAEPATTDSPSAYRLGAGTMLGQAIFQRYATVVRQQQAAQMELAKASQPQPQSVEPAAVRPIAQPQRWTIAILLDGLLIRTDGLGEIAKQVTLHPIFIEPLAEAPVNL